MTGGADSETDDALFSRAQEARSGPPQGGAVIDYEKWALEVEQITRAWVNQTPAQPGSVIVYIMTDNNTSTNGFPNGTNGSATIDTRTTTATGDQLDVANYIYGDYRRPVSACVNVVSPIAYPIDITIQSSSTISSTNKTAISAAIKAKFLSIGTPLTMTVYESDITSAISSVISDYNLVLPASSTSISLGYLPTVGTITYQ